jgi:hypothetical protein
MPGYSPQTVYPFAVKGLLVVSEVWVIVFGHKYSFKMRIVSTFMLSAVIVLILPFLAHLGGGAGFWSVFFTLVVFGVINGINQASIFQLAGGLPAHYIGALILGPGISGVFANFVRALTLIIWPVDTEPNNAFIGALIFFLICSAVNVFCGLLMYVLVKNEFAIYHLWQFEGFSPANYTSPDSAKTVKLSKKAGEVEHVTLGSLYSGVKENLSSTQGLLYAICFIYIISFILFPGVTNDASFGFLSNSNIHNPESWYQLASVFLFNVADTIGRLGGNLESWELKLSTTKGLTYARSLFFVTFLLTDFAVAPDWIWSADWFKVTNLSLFAFSNGYLTTLCALKVPGTVEA